MTGLWLDQIRQAEESAKRAGWSEIDLLRLAGERLGWAIGRFFPGSGLAVGYLGKGHNAADVVGALMVLRDAFGWNVAARCGYPQEEWAPLLRELWLQSGGISVLEEVPDAGRVPMPCLLLDGLCGVGLRGALREPLAGLVLEMNALRECRGFRIAAADVPSGIDADEGRPEGVCVVADATFQVAHPKRGLLLSTAVNWVGALAVVPIEPLVHSGDGGTGLIAPQSLRDRKSMPHDTHKGMNGRVSILAGSQEYSGAAILCATGALRAGAGLVFLHVPQETLGLVAARCPPEIIVRGVKSPEAALETEADSYVVGCGLGRWAEFFSAELVEAVLCRDRPMVVDADALNQLAAAGRVDGLSSHHVSTPHPGEFRRLAPDLSGFSPEDAALAFIRRSKGTLLLKGARTLVANREKGIRANSTGHRGMAKGGQGDFLAGVIGSLLAQGRPSFEAASLGAWICGRCGELAVWEGGESAESLCPTDSARWIGRAFEDWRMAAR